MERKSLAGGWLSAENSIPKILAIRACVMLGWAVAVRVFGLFGSVVLAFTFTEYTDPCNFNHVSANTGLGWSIVGVTVLIPTIVGIALRKYLTIPWVVLCSAYLTYGFVEVILNWNGC